MDHLRPGVRDQPDQYGKSLSLLKNKKSAGLGGAQILGRLKRKNHLNLWGRGYSELRSCHCTPALATEQHSVSKK